MTHQYFDDDDDNSNGNGNGSNDGNDENDVAQGKPKPEATIPASGKHFWPMGLQSFAPGVNVAFSPIYVCLYNVHIRTLCKQTKFPMYQHLNLLKGVTAMAIKIVKLRGAKCGLGACNGSQPKDGSFSSPLLLLAKLRETLP